LIKSNDEIYLSSGICYFEGGEENGLERIIVNYKIGGVERNKRKVGSYIKASLAKLYLIT